MFCGGSPLTREHLFPDWLGDIAPRAGGRIVWARYDEGREALENLREFDGRPFAQTVRSVCQACNNGWMSDLEARVKPHLEPMLRGERLILNEAAQATLAFWACKTAFVLESMLPARGGRVIPREHYAEMYRRKGPPDRIQVWAGCYAFGPDDPVGFAMLRRLSLPFPDPGGTGPNGYGITLAVHRALFQVYGHRLEVPTWRRIGGKAAEGLIEIRPSHGPLWWPAPVLFNWRSIRTLATKTF